MKKNILKLTLVLAISSFTLISCGGNEASESHEGHEHVAGKEYSCPMGCEGDKVHAEPGSCSVCGMDLEEVK